MLSKAKDVLKVLILKLQPKILDLVKLVAHPSNVKLTIVTPVVCKSVKACLISSDFWELLRLLT